MGHVDDPLNTFWQVFFRKVGSATWSLVTPPGVADNGGLVLDPGSGALLTVGVEPTQDLRFSPLAWSSDGGASWDPGLVPQGLASVPDALAGTPGDGAVALVRGGAGEVVASGRDASGWSTLTTRGALAATAAGRRCGVGTLGAVAVDGAGTALVGATCEHRGVVGIFVAAATPSGSGTSAGTTTAAGPGAGWHLAGPGLSGPLARAGTSVLRLADTGSTLTGVVETGSGGAANLAVLWADAAVSGWTTSALLPLGPSGRVLATGLGASGAVVVLVGDAHGTRLEIMRGPGTSWLATPAPPAGTATATVGADGTVDALAVHTSTLTDWRLDPTTATWTKTQVLDVPIQYGSSQ